MTSLQSYLAAGAVEDVRKLLAMPDVDGRRRVLATGHKSLLPISDMDVPPWRCLIMADTHYADMTIYYRATDSGYIVSDCGETVSEVMRRTGCGDHGARVQARAAIFGSPEGYALGIVNKGEQPWLMLADYVIQADRVTASDLPAAIVSVLSAVAKVRAAIDKDGGR